MFINCLFVGLGGAVGSVARYLLGLLPLHGAGDFPFVTLGINVAGAFCLGLIAAWAGRQGAVDPRLLLFLKVGLCGGFTTFSTFCNESVQLFQSGRVFLGRLYVLLSVVLGITAVFAAQFVAK